MKDLEISYGLVDRAAAAGFDTLLFTVDTPIAGNRMRDARNGFSIPPQLTAKTILDAIPRPWWWWDFLTTPKLEFASLTTTGGTVGQLLDSAMDPSIDYDDLAEIRALWPGRLAIKGVQTVADARKLADLGVDRAIEILSSEVRRTMKLLQVGSVAELEPRHVTQLRSLRPITPEELSPDPRR